MRGKFQENSLPLISVIVIVFAIVIVVVFVIVDSACVWLINYESKAPDSPCTLFSAVSLLSFDSKSANTQHWICSHIGFSHTNKYVHITNAKTNAETNTHVSPFTLFCSFIHNQPSKTPYLNFVFKIIHWEHVNLVDWRWPITVQACLWSAHSWQLFREI